MTGQAVFHHILRIPLTELGVAEEVVLDKGVLAFIPQEFQIDPCPLKLGMDVDVVKNLVETFRSMRIRVKNP